MFDVGFSEMIVIAVVALLVIGPEKLPRVARTVGALMGRMQRYVNDVKADINREIELDELKKMHTSVKEAAQSVESSVRDAVSSFEAQGAEMNAAISGQAAADAPRIDGPMSDADLAAAIQEAEAQALAVPEPVPTPEPVPVAQAPELVPEPVSAVAETPATPQSTSPSDPPAQPRPVA